MAEDTTPPRRRKLPVLGMTTVGLAVGAGSLGLYRGATAVQAPPPADQPTWTTAAKPVPAPAEGDGGDEVDGPAAPPSIVPAAYEEPVAPPSIPALPIAAEPASAPAMPELPVIPAAQEPPVAPAVAEAPAALPIAPALPIPVTPSVPAVPEVPAAPAIPAGLAVPEMPAAPAIPVLPAADSPKVPAPVMPGDPAKQWPRLPEANGETLPEPRPVTPLPRVPTPIEPAAPKAVEPPPLPAVPKSVELPPPLPAEPATPPAQPVQLPAAPLPVMPIAPVVPDLNLPPVQPGFTVNSTPEPPPTRQAPGVLSSLKPEPPGDAPVIPTYQTLKSAAVGAALAAAPLQAAEPQKTIPPAGDKADAAKTDPVIALKDEVKKLRESSELQTEFNKAIERSVHGVQDNETGKSTPGLVKRFEELDRRMKAIETKLKDFDQKKFDETLARIESKLNDLSDVKKTTTLKPDPNDAAPKPMPGPKPAATAMASVRILNTFPYAISLKVNSESYRVEPNESRTVDVPAGDYTYELLNTGSPVETRTLKPGQSETLRIK